MSGRDESRPPFTIDDASELAGRLYGLSGVFSELPSERDRNFQVKTDSGAEYVLKISATSEMREVLEFQNAAMQHLSQEQEFAICPWVIPNKEDECISTTKDSEGHEHFVRLLGFLPGQVLGKINPHTPQLLFDFGRFMGSLSLLLADFTHPGASRDFYWDMKNAGAVIHRYIDLIEDAAQKELVKHFYKEFDNNVVPVIRDLRASVIHNDGNDHNILVHEAHSDYERSFGILDFGDMVHSCTVFEIAIAAAYAILGKEDPLAAAAQVIGGYYSVFPLTDEEIDIVFYLVCVRLTMSVCVSAFQKTLEPESEYLVISEVSAWATLQKLRGIHPRYASYVIRKACGLEPCPNGAAVSSWLKKNRKKLGPIVEFDLAEAPYSIFDLSVGSLQVGDLGVLTDIGRFTRLLNDAKIDSGSDYLIGKYNEARLMYASDVYSMPSDSLPETRTVHLAIDLFIDSDKAILAPLDGAVHSVGNVPGPYDNGPTVTLEHNVSVPELKFYTLYAHLSEDSLEGIYSGMVVKQGDVIGRVGTYPTNGGWPSHLHFQVISDIFDWQGDYPGVARPSDRAVWLSICPDPNLILGLKDAELNVRSMTKEEILGIREEYLSETLSTSYKNPLKIVRGYMQYLYDDEGRAYLDARNNVPHVGHSHPRVVESISKQAAVLNTNTRYLHETLVEYARRLSEKLPKPLKVCFFVNSGSEANELALRLAKTHTGREDFIVIDGAYHGNTTALIDISPYKHDGPGGKGPPPHVHKVRMPDCYRGEYKFEDREAGKKYANDLLEIIERQSSGRGIAGFICESLMGCGGQIIFPKNYLKEAFAHVRKVGGVCIVDEVQVGFGRVGSHFWGFETQGVVPDIVTLGKPIGNGHPLAAVITTPEIAESFATGMEFFSTTGGNPVSCAAGMAVLDIIEEEDLQKNAREVGTYLVNKLKDLQKQYRLIGDVRGTGLFIGVELVLDDETLTPATLQASYVVNRMRELGVLLSTDGVFSNVLKIKPPMVFSTDNADFLVATLERVLQEDLANPTLTE